MTEEEWLGCTDPRAMLRFLKAKVSDRKLRLFGVACCRRIWHLLPDERSRRAVQVGELLADGLATEAEAEAAGNAAAEAASEVQGVPEEVGWRAAKAAEHLLPLPEESWWLSPVWEYAAVAMEGEQLVKEGATPEMLDAWSEQSVESGRAMGWTGINPNAMMTDILWEVVGPLPFRSVSLDPACLTPAVVSLAQTIYDDRAFDHLPILGDALEEAGCDNKDILGHCRGPGPHVRGCWPLDRILGRE